MVLLYKILQLISRKQCSLFSTTSIIQGSKNSLKNTKKKLVEPVVFKKKIKNSPLVEIKNKMTINELAKLLNRSHETIFEALSYVPGTDRFKKANDVIENLSIIKQVVGRCGYRFKVVSNAEKVSEQKEAHEPKHEGPRKDFLTSRAPVVTIMGHVDHGKTTLLDSLRCSHMVEHEFGGITQHIGAFSVKMNETANAPYITFLDTPGHAAFSSMRERGTKVTDLVVLVVAADDGVMKQTEESIHFINHSQVPMIVAINKCDKSNADIEKTKKSLLKHGVQLEEFGGDVQAVQISALKGENLESLKECIMAQAEMMQLQADEGCHVQAVCLESSLHQSRGKLATVLIQHGTLKRGDILVAGKAWAKVRGMFDEHGMPVQQSKPGHAVQVIGWKSLPSAGEKIIQVPDEHEAKRLVGLEEERELNEKVEADQEVINTNMAIHYEAYKEQRRKRLEQGIRMGKNKGPKPKESAPIDDFPKLSIILKGDVDGSVEAILDVLDGYKSSKCRLDLLSYGVGAATENDVQIASLFKGIIYSFNVNTPDRVKALAKQQGVTIVDFNIIYRLLEHLRTQLTKKLLPIIVKQITGEANVLANFVVTEGKKKVNVAGCRCSKGTLNKKQLFKLIRDGEVLIEGTLLSLKHHKNEVESIKTDVECGLSFADQSHQPQQGDQIICYELVSKTQEIDWNLDFL